MASVYRSMNDDGEGHPLCGPSARMLGVRIRGDVAVSIDGVVSPGTGGMSVAVGSPRSLPRHRRPPEHGGIGEDPVWQIDVRDLPDTLVYRADRERPDVHGFIEPREPVSLDDYQVALATSRTLWERI